jgi:dTDP-L-rhamnose 4-epimerase
MSNVLVTGGAGFIGSHLVNALLHKGHKVRVLDAFIKQVHGDNPRQLPSDVEVIKGDVRDREAVRKSLEGTECIFHLAAEVGVGQSMYEIHRYIDANTTGTAIFLEELIAKREQIKKLLVASSMSIYGEGAYICPSDRKMISPVPRTAKQLARHEWELRCDECEEELKPIGTPETKPPHPTSVYAVSKKDQEEYCLIVGKAYNIPTVALRFFNIYGPGQSLSNPYTGAIAIFSSRLMNNQPPLIFEDGLQSRDFTYVTDVAEANISAMESDAANYEAINVGTGIATPIIDIVPMVADGLGVNIKPQVIGKFREGDIRHCVADISKAKKLLGYEPKVALKEGITKLLDWLKEQDANDAVEKATAELKARGLVK